MIVRKLPARRLSPVALALELRKLEIEEKTKLRVLVNEEPLPVDHSLEQQIEQIDQEILVECSRIAKRHAESVRFSNYGR